MELFMENHISICICTYKRPKMLERLLNKLINQITENKFIYSIVIVDNDKDQSAKEIVESYKNKNLSDVKYINVMETNIALVRNTAINNAIGNYIAFIDDDEFPIDNWLVNHLNTLSEYHVDGSLGPVLPYFEVEPPKWIIKGKLCERKRFSTGTILTWKNTRTGNVLLKKEIFNNDENLFDLSFGLGGEDVDFFRRMINKGFKFISCDQAIVYEEVPDYRLKLTYLLKRAFLSGNISYNYLKNELTLALKLKVFIKSSISVFVYSIILPILLIFSFHHFVKYLIKLINHFSRLLNVLGLYSIKKRNL
jgi:succinoglycan biosynthesis protein ExoM